MIICGLGVLRKGNLFILFSFSVSMCRIMLVSEECSSFGLV